MVICDVCGPELKLRQHARSQPDLKLDDGYQAIANSQSTSTLHPADPGRNEFVWRLVISPTSCETSLTRRRDARAAPSIPETKRLGSIRAPPTRIRIRESRGRTKPRVRHMSAISVQYLSGAQCRSSREKSSLVGHGGPPPNPKRNHYSPADCA